jgi:WS/DGAT/MGAT family acyltransferase
VADSPQNRPEAAKKAPAKKAPAKKAPAKKAPAKKAPAKKAPAKKATAKTAPVKAPATKAPAKKAPAKKAPAKKAPATTAAKAPAKPQAKKLRGGDTVTEARRLGGWDFATWRMATDDPVMRSTILGVLVLDSSPDWDKLSDRYERASRLAPVLRSKVVEGPTGLETPRVVVDPNFDLSFHMRRFRMPDGSTWRDVLDEARRQSMADFDKDRPLWRVTLLEGLPGGKSVLVQKLHHAIADGQGAVQLGLALLDFTPEGAELGPMPAAPDPVLLDTKGFMQAVIRNNAGWVARTAEDAIKGFGPLAAAALRHPRTLFSKFRETAESVVRFTKVSSEPLSPILKGRSINYHFDTIDMDFEQFKAAAKKRNRTVNDLFLAAISVGMYDYHQKMGHPVDELRMNMPISLRTSAEETNAVTIARFEIPVSNVIDEVLEIAANTVRSWRAEPALKLADYLAELSRFLPPELVSAAAQTSDLTASNVPGIPVPVWLSGARVERMYPLVGTVGAAINVTMLTYTGTASVGVSSDDAAVTDRAALLDSLRLGFREVVGDAFIGDPISGDLISGH